MGDVMMTPTNNRAAARRFSTPGSAAWTLGNLAARELVKYAGRKAHEYVSGNNKKRKAKSQLKRDSGKAGTVSKVQAGSSRAVSVKVGKRKVKKKKIVKVSGPLRAKINKVLEGKKYSGYYQVTMYGSLKLPAVNEQLPQTLNDPLHTATVFSSFSVKEFLHEVSVLWNEKVDSAANRNVTEGSIGVSARPGNEFNLPPDAVSNLAVMAKFTVLNSYERYYMKNNSERTVEIQIYVCTPKKPMFENAAEFDEAGVPRGAVPYYGSDPVKMWDEALQVEYKVGGNIANHDEKQLHTSPLGHKVFTDLYTTEITNLVLEPGQDYRWVLPGPKMLEIDTAKCYALATNSILQSVQKFSKCVMFVTKQDLTGQGASGSAISNRSVTATDSSPNIVSVERVLCSRLSIPEQVGMKLIGTNVAASGGAIVQNLHRIKKFYVATYTTSGVGSIRRVDEQQGEDKVL